MIYVPIGLSPDDISDQFIAEYRHVMVKQNTRLNTNGVRRSNPWSGEGSRR
jgi:hypothetical protein